MMISWPKVVDDTRALFQLSAKAAQAEGLVCEFGVRTGGSARHLIDIFGAPVYGFDWFKGLPEAWAKSPSYIAPVGYFPADVPAIDGLEIVNGLFEETVGPFFSEHRETIRFAHIDCDIYSATVTVLNAIKPLLAPGSVIQFDEICQFERSNYDNWKEGEWKALIESGIQWEPIGRTTHEQAAIKITDNGCQ